MTAIGDDNMLQQIQPGDRVSVEVFGRKFQATVKTANNYGKRDYAKTGAPFLSDDWYLELSSDVFGYVYVKQVEDKAFIRKIE